MTQDYNIIRGEFMNDEREKEIDEDKLFENWVSQRILEETEEMIKGLEASPDLEDFKPSKVLFERIVKEARKRGLLEEDDKED